MKVGMLSGDRWKQESICHVGPARGWDCLPTALGGSPCGRRAAFSPELGKGTVSWVGSGRALFLPHLRPRSGESFLCFIVILGE